MSIASWAVFRQLEAVRDAMGSTLQRGVIAKTDKPVPPEKVIEWLHDQGMECFDESHPFVNHIWLGRTLNQSWGSEVEKRGARSAHDAQDIARERSGADFYPLSEFVITSAFVRMLGAHEQFERDTLKALFYYRPIGRSSPSEEYRLESVDESVVGEVGQPEGEKTIFEKPPIWTWISKLAENNIERHRIFSYVFGIKCLSSKQDFRKLYDQRNLVVHGRQGVTMKLVEYCDAEDLVIQSVLQMVKECRERYQLEV